MAPIWMAVRGELSEYSAVAQIRRIWRCDVSGVERHSMRYMGGLDGPTDVAVSEHPLARCIRRVAHVFLREWRAL